MTDLTRTITRGAWGAARRLVRWVYACMSIAVERGAASPTSRFNRLLRHGIEEVLA